MTPQTKARLSNQSNYQDARKTPKPTMHTLPPSGFRDSVSLGHPPRIHGLVRGLSQRLWGPNVGARDALSSFSNDHAITFVGDLHDERRAAVDGKRTLTPFTPSCKLLVRDASSTIKLSTSFFRWW